MTTETQAAPSVETVPASESLAKTSTSALPKAAKKGKAKPSKASQQAKLKSFADIPAPTPAPSPADANKARVAARSTALDDRLAGAREALEEAGRAAAKAFAKADGAKEKAGLELMEEFYAQGHEFTRLKLTVDYDDVKDIVAATIATAYKASPKNSQKTWRSYAKTFFLAGVAGLDSAATTISSLYKSYTEQLVAAGVKEEDTRSSRQPSMAGEKATGSTATSATVTSSTGSTELRYVPRKQYTVDQLHACAMILTRNGDLAAKLEKVLVDHRDQFVKWCNTILASDVAAK
jgi:hypothetical protein